MGLGVVQDAAQLRPTKDAIAKSLQKRGSKNGPDKRLTNDGEGAKKGSKTEPKNRPKTDPKVDPNIISLRVGSLRLSGVGGWPCQRKRRRNRSRKGGLSYVAENEEKRSGG